MEEKIEIRKDTIWLELSRRGDQADLLEIVLSGAEEYRKKAWEELLKRGPLEGVLHDIVQAGSSEYKLKAARMLLERETLKETSLLAIINQVEGYRKEAFQRLMKQGCSMDALYYLEQCGPQELQNEAKRLREELEILRKKSTQELVLLLLGEKLL
jgi:hypothetical protein